MGPYQRFETADVLFFGLDQRFIFVSAGQRFQIAGSSFVGLDRRRCVKGQASVFSGCSFSVACVCVCVCVCVCMYIYSPFDCWPT